jgi:hypothetical protein
MRKLFISGARRVIFPQESAFVGRQNRNFSRRASRAGAFSFRNPPLWGAKIVIFPGALRAPGHFSLGIRLCGTPKSYFFLGALRAPGHFPLGIRICGAPNRKFPPARFARRVIFL